MSKTKIGRNEMCPCDSGKKYKNCCIEKEIALKSRQQERIIYGDEFVSNHLKNFANILKKEFPKHETIDVSRVVTCDTYKPLQLQHFKKRVIMLVERLPENDHVFKERIPIESIRYMIMYKGAYQCFEVDPYHRPDFDLVFKMIKKRDEDQIWEEN